MMFCATMEAMVQFIFQFRVEVLITLLCGAMDKLLRMQADFQQEIIL